jgi:hypothetical protein
VKPDRNRRRRRQQRGLAEPVDQARDLRRGEALVSAKVAATAPGQPVFAVGLGQHGDDADRGHGDRQAGDETGGGESPWRRAP